MLNVFIGLDTRQPVAFTALQQSIHARASRPVSVTPLLLHQLPVTRRGLTEFTFTRYLVPWLMRFEGVGLFLDADMIVRGDIAELFDLADAQYAVQVVKCRQRFEWPSLMLFNCARCLMLTPEYVEHGKPEALEFGPVGELPPEWNHCIGYEEPNPDAKLLHYTTGIPVFEEVQKLGFVNEWRAEIRAACSTVSWQDLMGKSVHTWVLGPSASRR